MKLMKLKVKVNTILALNSMVILVAAMATVGPWISLSVADGALESLFGVGSLEDLDVLKGLRLDKVKFMLTLWESTLIEEGMHFANNNFIDIIFHPYFEYYYNETYQSQQQHLYKIPEKINFDKRYRNIKIFSVMSLIVILLLQIGISFISKSSFRINLLLALNFALASAFSISAVVLYYDTQSVLESTIEWIVNVLTSDEPEVSSMLKNVYLFQIETGLICQIITAVLSFLGSILSIVSDINTVPLDASIVENDKNKTSFTNSMNQEV